MLRKKPFHASVPLMRGLLLYSAGHVKRFSLKLKKPIQNDAARCRCRLTEIRTKRKEASLHCSGCCWTAKACYMRERVSEKICLLHISGKMLVGNQSIRRIRKKKKKKYKTSMTDRKNWSVSLSFYCLPYCSDHSLDGWVLWIYFGFVL